MCTVIFIHRDKEIYFGSLRDESPKRPRAAKPEISELNGVSFLSPQDAKAGGTWIGVSSTGNVIVLLNGGFENHQRKNYYRKSRGLIVSELLASEMPVVEWNLIDMEDIEPFTLIVWSDNNLFQLVWDGSQRHRIRLDETLPYIWSSSTLYNLEVKAKREELFQNWIAMNPPFSKLSLLNFFKSHSDAENGFIMNRMEITKTLSFSFIELRPNNDAVMSYYDFSNYSYSTATIELQSGLKDCIISGDLRIRKN
jgi:uncharacterized protein with NRDE domain